MINKKTFSLCQPDDRKGCAACCGLFNFLDLSKENLEKHLDKGKNSPQQNFLHDNELRHHHEAIRDNTSYICPHIGFISPENPGCLIHPLAGQKDLRDHSFFGEKICGSYSCPAYTILSGEDKEILVSSIDDWYPYTIAVIDPDSFLWAHNYIKNFLLHDIINTKTGRDLLDAALRIHSRYLAKTAGPVFFYSEPEYRLGSTKFSLLIDQECTRKEKEEIADVLDRML